MRFVSQFTNFIINVRNPKKKVTDFGVEILEPEIVAEFDYRAWNQQDMEVAFRTFQFKGQFQHEDEATPVPPTYRLSIYDTDQQAELQGWTDEEKEMVEQRLLSAKSYGRDFILVEEVPLEPPWPAYDRFAGDADELVMHILDMGFDPEAVINYEQSKWGQNREEVVAGLQSAIEARDAGEIIVS